jgi:hypothetical protein
MRGGFYWRMSGCGTKRRKPMSARMSAIGGRAAIVSNGTNSTLMTSLIPTRRLIPILIRQAVDFAVGVLKCSGASQMGDDENITQGDSRHWILGGSLNLLG